MIIDIPSRDIGSFNTKAGSIMMETKTHKSGLLYRTDVVDLLSIREALFNYRNLLVSNRIVMDIGANVGGFTHLALKNGATKVYAYEPEPHTYALLANNVGGNYQCEIFNRALTASSEKEISFYVGYGVGSPSRASTEYRKGRANIKVLNECFLNEANRIQPNTIKMDIEGGEYDIVLDIPDSCDELALEWHGSTDERRQKFNVVYPEFIKKGWVAVTEKKKESFKKYTISKGRIPRWAIDAHYRR